MAEGRKLEELRRELQRLKSLISFNERASSERKPASKRAKCTPSLSHAELEEAINKAKLLVAQEELEEELKEAIDNARKTLLERSTNIEKG